LLSTNDNKSLSLNLIVPNFLDQDVENIFNTNSKETFIKDLSLTVNFLVNSKSLSKITIANEIDDIYPFWLANTLNSNNTK
jgi:hypothetical protein